LVNLGDEIFYEESCSDNLKDEDDAHPLEEA
jgi:hypothetical protein